MSQDVLFPFQHQSSMDVVLNVALYEQEDCLICMHNYFYVKQLVKREHFIHKISICFKPSWDLRQTAEL